MTESAEARRLDDLRRALYRADASDADVRRYLSERLKAGPAPAPAPQVSRRRPRRTLLAIGAALVLLSTLAVGVRLEQPAATIQATRAPRPVPTSVGDAAAVLGPTRVAVLVDGEAVSGFRFEGSGSVVLPFDPPPGSYDGGRAVVALVTGEPAPVVWRALRLTTRQDWTSFPQVLAQGTAGRAVDLPATEAFGYRGLPPTRVAVEAPVGTRWSLVVGITGAADTELR
jgi:hypothetical protein